MTLTLTPTQEDAFYALLRGQMRRPRYGVTLRFESWNFTLERTLHGRTTVWPAPVRTSHRQRRRGLSSRGGPPVGLSRTFWKKHLDTLLCIPARSSQSAFWRAPDFFERTEEFLAGIYAQRRVYFGTRRRPGTWGLPLPVHQFLTACLTTLGVLTPRSMVNDSQDKAVLVQQALARWNRMRLYRRGQLADAELVRYADEVFLRERTWRNAEKVANFAYLYGRGYPVVSNMVTVGVDYAAPAANNMIEHSSSTWLVANKP